jgi:hypothetical protein
MFSALTLGLLHRQNCGNLADLRLRFVKVEPFQLTFDATSRLFNLEAEGVALVALG